MAEKSSGTRNIIKSFEAKALRKRTFAQRLADWMTDFFGSINFLIVNLTVFGVWILINRGWLPSFLLFIPRFDPYPHVLLITAVSLEAIILAIVVLMSQNRQSRTATLRDELQLQVELVEEREISKALKLLTMILAKKGIKLKDNELKEMLKIVDTSYIEKKLEEQLVGRERGKE